MKLKNMKTKTVVTILISATFLLIFLFCALTIYDFVKITKIDVSGYTISNENIVYVFNPFSTDGKTIGFCGYIYKSGERIETKDCYIVLQDINDNSYYKVKTNSFVLNDAEPNEYNYELSGISARVMKSFLKNNTQYRVCVLYLNNNENLLVPLEIFFDL